MLNYIFDLCPKHFELFKNNLDWPGNTFRLRNLHFNALLISIIFICSWFLLIILGNFVSLINSLTDYTTKHHHHVAYSFKFLTKCSKEALKNHYVPCNQKPVYWSLLQESVCSFTISKSFGKAKKFHPLDTINCTLVFYFYIYLIDVYSPDGKCGGDYRKCIGRKDKIFWEGHKLLKKCDVLFVS